MAIPSRLARQLLVDGGFDELSPEPGGGDLGPRFRHRELPRPWSITAALGPGEQGDAVAHLDVFLEFWDQQVGNIHRVTSHPALVSHLPAIVSSLTALVGSAALTCPRCGSGWVTVRELGPGGGQTAFFACADSCEPGPVLGHVHPIVTY